MKAMVLRGKNLAIEDVAKPAPGPNQVLAKVLACGICGSDLHAAKYIDEMMAATAGSRQRAWYSQDLSNGIVMGHEFVAEVVEAGEGVTGWAPGTRVTSMPILMTPEPPGVTTIGYSPVYPGAYGEYVLMTAPMLLKVPDNVSDLVAATTEPCAVGLHAVRESGIKPGQPALVMGAGPIGLMTLLWLKKEGVKYVAVSDYSAERRALAKQLGADDVFDPAAGDLAEALSEKLGPEHAPPMPGALAAPALVFECVGVEGTLQQAMELVAVRGKVVVVGVCMKEDRMRPMTGINKQLTVVFVLGYTGEEYAEALQAFGEGTIDTSPMVTRTIGIDELPATFEALADPKDCKVVVVP